MELTKEEDKICRQYGEPHADGLAKFDMVNVIRSRDCIYHKEKRCTVWRERAVIVECYTDDDGFCYMAKRK